MWLTSLNRNVVCNAVVVKIISMKMFIRFNLFEPVWTNLVQLSRKLHKLILQWLHGLWRHCAYLHDNSIKLYCRGVHLLTCRLCLHNLLVLSWILMNRITWSRPLSHLILFNIFQVWLNFDHYISIFISLGQNLIY